MSISTRLQNMRGVSSKAADAILNRLEAGDPNVLSSGFPFLSAKNAEIVSSPLSQSATFAARDLIESISYARIHTPATPVIVTGVVGPTNTLALSINMASVQANDPTLTSLYYPFVDVRVALPPLTTGPISDITVAFSADGMPTEHSGSAWPANPITRVAQIDVAKAVEIQFMPYVLRRSTPHLVMGLLTGTAAVSVTLNNLPEGSQVSLTLPGSDHYTVNQTLAAALSALK